MGAAFSLRADVTVVFNEVMYHPQTNESAFEWVELHNQMAVDLDISGWSLAKAVDFTFPQGTAIAAGGFLVVALSPTNIAAVFGITNVIGPFAGRLGNSGDTIELRNNNQRLMDSVTYGPKGDWPVAPDGAGPSLSKLDEESASGDATNWRASVQVGGSPGMRNFPGGSNSENIVVHFDSAWKYTAIAPTGNWRAADFDAGTWLSGTGVFADWRPGDTQAIATLFSSGLDAGGVALAPGQLDPHYQLAASAYGTNPAPAMVMQNHSAWTNNDSTSRWIGVVSNGTTSVSNGLYQFRTTFDLSSYDPTNAVVTLQVAVDNILTNIALNGTMRGLSFTGFAAFSPVFTITNGFLPATNTLDFFAWNSGAGPSGFRVKAGGSSTKSFSTNAVLSTGGTSYYFRTTFVVTGDVTAASLRLRATVDDGAVFNLNGAEILRLNMPSGAISNGTPATTNIGSAGISGPFFLPGTSLISGTNFLAVELHQAVDGTNDATFGAELTVCTSNSPLPQLPTLAFNEMPYVTNANFWVEIMNYGTTNVPMTNYVFKRFGLPDQEYIIPPTNLPPGGFLVIERAQLGWGADPGDQIVLYTPGKSNVVDAMVAKRYPRARFPDGTGTWMHPSVETKGATNQFAFNRDIVINEIMYHPRDPQGPATNSPEQWIELFNRGSNAVDLTGWRIDKNGNTIFSFPDGKTISAGGYLVVARDVAYLAAMYSGADIIGNFSSRLSGGDALLELFDAANYPADGWGNLADSVHYRDSRPWPEYTDGLGSSLELRDPRADNSRPEAWAASDDRTKASWQTITYSATATVETASSPTVWKEFVFGLLDSGEILLDDISVIESPTGTARQLIQNGNFESGMATWRCIGTQKNSEVIVDPDNAANHVLHLVSDGYAEHMHNHVETTLTNNLPITNGLVYEVSFRAKWLAGCNRLNTRLYFNRLARIHELAVPALNGTPGAQNSRHVANIGPTFSSLRHLPVVPTNGQPVSVSVNASDPDGIVWATLHYAVGGGTWQDVLMTPGSNADGSVSLSAGIPGQAAGTNVQFYVEAADAAGAISYYPAGGTNSRALFGVSDGTIISQRLRTVRLLMTPADTAWMHSDTNVMSNDEVPCTVITDERTVAYDSTVHLQGSERGRDNTTRVGFTIRYPSDQPFRGVLDGFTIDRSGGYSGKGGDNDEILLKHIINRAGMLPGMYDDLCQFIAPRAQDTGTGLMILAKYGSEFLNSQYKNGNDGDMFKLELIYYPTTTVVTNDPQSAKMPQPDGVIGTDFRDLGDDAEQYRWIFLKENHTARNNYAPMVALAKAFSTTGAVLDAQMSALMDVDEWMRSVAYIGLIGGSDIYTYGNSHNHIIYFRPEDGKAMGFLWDLDYSFVQATNNVFPGTGSANTTKLINRPANLHAYYGHINDLANFTGDTAYNSAWASNYAPRVGQNWSGAVTWLAQRAAWVKSQLALSTPFVITNNSGNGFTVSNSYVTIGGTAPVSLSAIFVNGVNYQVTWLSATNWLLTIPLTDYANAMTLQGFDLRGATLSNALTSITVTNLGLAAPRPVVVNEWMADNKGPGGYPDPANGNFSDWFELYNPNAAPVDLSGFHLTDDLSQPSQWTVPTNTVIPARGFLLLWADGSTPPGTSSNGDLHTNFKLSASGEAIGLYNSAGVLQHAIVFSQQWSNVSQGLFPDGSTNTFYFMTNWTPRAANQLSATTSVSSINCQAGSIGLGLSGTPGHLYRIEFNDTITSPLWTLLSTNRASSFVIQITDTPSATQRFYRAQLIP